MDDKDIRRLTRLTAITTQLQTRRLITAAGLAEGFHVSLRTIYRDIKTLGRAGIPIITVEGKGYKLMDGYKLPPVMFTEEEANALVTAERLVQTGSDKSLYKEYASALSKVRAVLRQPAKEKSELLSERIAVSPVFSTAAASSSLVLIQQALTSFEVLQITYHAQHSDEKTERMVEPFALYYSLQESWLLIAWCRLREDFRMFRLDRLLHIQPLGQHFRPHKLSLAQFLDEKQKKFLTPDIPLSYPAINLHQQKQREFMNLVSIRIITAEVRKLAAFYEQITGLAATHYTEDFAELQTGSATLAIGSTRTLQLFGSDAIAQAAQNRSAIVEFLTEDVDESYDRLKSLLQDCIVQKPTTMPWGNRSLLFRDPDGNLVNFFTPVSPEAIKKFA